MRNLKKVLSLTLAFVMLLGMMMIGASAVETTFPDNGQIAEEYKEAAAVMNALKIFKGDENGNLNPKSTLTRAEAATLLTTMTIGDAAKGLEGSKDSAFFTDMKGHWASGYVDYCASVNVVKGTSATTFNPSGKLTGTAFAAMLLRAAGVPESSNFTGNAWETNVIVAASKYNIANVTRGEITREAATKMALEGLMVSPGGETTTYVVRDSSGSVLYNGDSAVEAYVIKTAALGSTITTETKREDSLGWKNFGLKKTSGTDALGRPINAWTANNDVKVEVLSSAAVVTYTEPVKENKIFSDLGAKGIKGSTTFVVMDEVWVDGVKVAMAEKKSDTSYAPDTKLSTYDETYKDIVVIDKNVKDKVGIAGSGYGAKVEIFATGTDNHYKMVITNEYLAKVSKVTAAKNDNPRTIDLTIYNAENVKGFETEDFAKGDMVIVTLKDGAVDTINLAETVEDVSITKRSGSGMTATVTTEDGALHFNPKTDKEQDATGVFGGSPVDGIFNAGFTFYFDSTGNVIGSAITDNGPASGAFMYVKAYQGKVGSTLQGGGDGAASVKASVIFADGTSEVIDLAVSNDKFNQPAADGTITNTDVKNDANNVSVNNWFSYTENDGKYTLREASRVDGAKVLEATSAVSFSKGTVKRLDGKYTNSKTAIIYVDKDGKVEEMTGLVGMTIAKDLKYLIVANDSNVITNIYVVNGDPISTVDATHYYAIAAGDVTADGTEWTFAVDGEAVTYPVKSGVSITANKVYTVTLKDDVVTAATAIASSRVKSGKIQIVDEAFIQIEESEETSSIYYLSDDTAIYNVEGEEIETDEFAEGDTVTLVVGTGDSAKVIYTAYITASAEE